MSYSSEPAARSVAEALAWPLSLGPALVVLFAGSGFAFAALGIQYAGVIGLVSGLILIAFLAVGVSRYLFLVLIRTTLGHKEAPLLTLEHFNLADDMRFSLVLVWLLLIASSGLFANPSVTAVLIVISVPLMPAAVTLLAVTGDLLGSINPRRIVRVALRMGLSYLYMVGATMLGAIGLLLLLSGRPPFLAEILGIYVLIVAFHLQGRLAYAKRERLRFRAEKSPEIDQERNNAATDKAIQLVLDRIHPLSKVHEYQQALAALETAIEELGAGDELVEAFSERILELENPEVGLLYLQKRITAVLSIGQTEAAWQLCQRGLAVTSRFHPATGDEAVLLTRHGFEAGAHRKAMLLVMEFDERYPQLPELLPSAAILEARVLAEKLGHPEAARGRLRHLCQKHASCACSDELIAYLKVLDQAG